MKRAGRKRPVAHAPRGPARRAHAAEERYAVYTDGGCHPNPGRGGWGVVVLRGNRAMQELLGSQENTTNNRMELTAAIEALRALPDGSKVDLHTDSTYVRDGITTWIAGWRKCGWRTKDGGAVKNQDLWQALDSALQRHDVHWHWVRGHAGNVHNERADALAAAAIRNGHHRAAQAQVVPELGQVDLFVAVSYSGKTDRGGWAVVLRFGEAKKVLKGTARATTANRLGLVAVLTGLRALTRPAPVRVFCASDYVVDGATRWLAGWQARNWRTSEGKEVVNRDLWQELVELLRDDVEWVGTGGVQPPTPMAEAKAAAAIAASDIAAGV